MSVTEEIRRSAAEMLYATGHGHLVPEVMAGNHDDSPFLQAIAAAAGEGPVKAAFKAGMEHAAGILEHQDGHGEWREAAQAIRNHCHD